MDAAREIGLMFAALCGFSILFVSACIGFAVWAWRRKRLYGGRSVAKAGAHILGEISATDFDLPDLFD